MWTSHNHSEEITVYLIVCKNQSGEIIVPPYTAFEEQEAISYFEENSCEPGQSLYGHELVRILKAFVVKNGRIIWANREGLQQEEARYIAMDFGCYGIPNVYFRSLLKENEADLKSNAIARIC